MKPIQLYCFPFAGGSATSYYSWKSKIDPRISICPVELAGRGTRMGEPLYPSVSQMIADIFQRLEQSIETQPYAFYGHSMGGLISYELTRQIQNRGLPLPKSVFISGKGAPHLPKKEEEIYSTLERKAFIERVVNLGGVNKEVFDHPEFAELFIPLLRNDFRLVESYQADLEQPLACPLTLFFGEDDFLTQEEMELWSLHAGQSLRVYSYPGDHFFINDHTSEILSIISQQLIAATHLISP